MLGYGRRTIGLAMCWFAYVMSASASFAQDPSPQASDASAGQHEHMNMTAGWQFMQDGIVFAEFDHQGGPRGGDQFSRRTGGWAWRAEARRTASSRSPAC